MKRWSSYQNFLRNIFGSRPHFSVASLEVCLVLQTKHLTFQSNLSSVWAKKFPLLIFCNQFLCVCVIALTLFDVGIYLFTILGQPLRAPATPRPIESRKTLEKIIFLVESLHTINLRNFEHRRQRKSTDAVAHPPSPPPKKREKKKLLPIFKKSSINQVICLCRSV